MMRAILPVALLVLVACSDDAGARGNGGPHPVGDARVGGQVVSTVDGVAITREEVLTLAREARITPRQALRQLQDRELVGAEAARRGLDEDPDVQLAATRAAVHVLLEREVEERVTVGTIPDEEVRALYEARLSHYQQAERRRVSHLVVLVQRREPPARWAQAERFARQAVSALRGETDPSGALDAIAAGAPADLTMRVERLPPFAVGGGYDRAFEQAVFSSPRLGLLPAPVRTDFGWHAIVLDEVLPPVSVPLEVAAPELRQELVLVLRRRRLDELVRELEGRFPVRRYETTIASAISGEPVMPSEER